MIENPIFVPTLSFLAHPKEKTIRRNIRRPSHDWLKLLAVSLGFDLNLKD